MRRTRYMRNVGVFKDAHYFGDRIALADMGEEFIAQALSLGRSFDQSRDIHEFYRRRYDFFRVGQCRELIQPLIGHGDNPHVRLNRAEGVV